jgi:carboxypeptidase Q
MHASRYVSPLLCCVLLAPAMRVHAQAPPLPPAAVAAAEAIRASALSGTEAYELVRSLTVEVGPRLAGSQGDRAAVAWALTQLQDRSFANVRAQSVEVPHWERGVATVRIVEPYPQPLAAVALGGSVGTDDTGIEGAVVEVADLDELAALPPGAVRGRIVYFSKRMGRARDGAAYAATVPARTRGASEAARRGATAVLLRSVGTSASRVGHTGTTRYEPDVPPIPAFALPHADADLLEQQLAGGANVVVELHSTARMLPAARSANVIGDVPGTGEGIVVLGAHLDSWDLGTGAIDDGAGVAIVIAAANLIAKQSPRPARTVRVVLFANEEFGLSGAKAYAESLGDELAAHALGIEADFGAGRIWRMNAAVAEPALPAIDAIHAALAPLGVERGEAAARGGADLGPLRALGMPVIDLWHDGTAYFDHHHTADDTLDKIGPRDLDQPVAAYAVAAYLAASATVDFGRLPPPATP